MNDNDRWDISDDIIQSINHVRQQVVPDFMRRKNVVACGVGLKVQGSRRTNEPCVVVSVTQKEPAERLSSDDLIPRAVDSVVTDVIETGNIVAHGLDRTSLLRPVRPGMSIGHVNGTAGTIGCVVRRGEQHFILSANHVLALLNQAHKGDAILQPGPADGGTHADSLFGQLVDYVPMRFISGPTVDDGLPSDEEEPQGCAAILSSLLQALARPATASPAPVGLSFFDNYVDAAIAAPAPGVSLDPDIIDVGGPPAGIARPALGKRIVKSGRTTGLTHGHIVQVDVTVDVQFDYHKARFVNQIMCTPISKSGDSGALVLDYERNALGLLFSGSNLVTMMTPVQTVLQAFDVELITEEAIL